MALPAIETPTYQIELPHTKEKVKFRPFLVKEEKLLVMANESGEQDDMIRATQQIITNCSFGEVDGDALPLFALQKIFMDIRAQSISNVVDLVFTCGECKAANDYSMDLTDITLTEDPDHTNMVKISDDIIIEMTYPDAFDLAELLRTESVDTVYRISGSCVHTIYEGDERFNAFESSDAERQEWVERLTVDQFVKLREFFETMPVLEHEVNFTCKGCGKPNFIEFNGYKDFFV